MALVKPHKLWPAAVRLLVTPVVVLLGLILSPVPSEAKICITHIETPVTAPTGDLDVISIVSQAKGLLADLPSFAQLNKRVVRFNQSTNEGQRLRLALSETPITNQNRALRRNVILLLHMLNPMHLNASVIDDLKENDPIGADMLYRQGVLFDVMTPEKTAFFLGHDPFEFGVATLVYARLMGHWQYQINRFSVGKGKNLWRFALNHLHSVVEPLRATSVQLHLIEEMRDTLTFFPNDSNFEKPYMASRWYEEEVSAVDLLE